MHTPPSDMDRTAFLRRFSGVYEHSPWIAEQVFDAGLDNRHDDPEFLNEAFRIVIFGADRVMQIGLLRAHPPLAAARSADLTSDSRREQSGAGLDRCSDAELAEFQALNDAYFDRFGFPFIMAVKGHDRLSILQTFRARVQRDANTEFTEAMEQVCLIGRSRLEERFSA